MNARPLLPVFLAVLLMGCRAEEPKMAVKAPPAQTTAPVTQPDASTPTPPASQDKIPDELKTAAYQYYGLDNDQPIDMEVRTTADAGVRTGAQITRLKSVEGGKAVYTIERTGSLTDLLGQMDVSLEPDGIYVKSSSVAKVGDRDVEMPSKLEPGATWQARTVVDQPGRELNVLVSFKVVGEESITTPKGNRTALRVDSIGEGTLLGKKVRMDSQSWYVKDYGMVKSVLKYTGDGGTASTITIQESK